MSITTIPTRTSADPTSATDINTLMANDMALYASLGGGSSLPSQTGKSGKFLTTDGTSARWGTVSAGGGDVFRFANKMSGNIYVPSSIEFEMEMVDAITLNTVKAKLGTACTGSNTNIAFFKDSSTIATLSISTSSTSVVSKSISATIGANSVLSWKPTQVGSSVAGANLLVSGKGSVT